MKSLKKLSYQLVTLLSKDNGMEANQSYLMLISLVLFQPNFPNDDNSKPLHCITLFMEENARMSSFKSLSEVLIKSSKGGTKKI